MTEPTPQELGSRIERVKNEVRTAELAVSQALQAFNRSVVNGESELNRARTKKDLDEAREKLADAAEREKLLTEALHLARDREAAHERDGKVRAGTALLAKRTAEFEKLEAAVAAIAGIARGIVEMNVEVLAAFPERPADMPAMFSNGSLERVIGLRLMALTEGKLVPTTARCTVYESQQMPTLTQRAAAEQARMLDQFGVRAEPNQSGPVARSQRK
jgi:hypothetical protein